MVKHELRKLFNFKRIGLSKDDIAHRCKKIEQFFFTTFDLTSIKVVHIFLSIEKNNEPDTWPIIHRIVSDCPQVQVAIPRVNSERQVLENYFFQSENQLKKNQWDIPEPIAGTPVPTENIDMILVPLLIFDLHGNRIGYGKGFYDKFLSQCRPDAKRIGISLFEPVEEITDVDKYDIPLHYCITPDKVYDFVK